MKVRQLVNSGKYVTAEMLMPKAGFEPAHPFGQRILSSSFAQTHATRGDRTQYNLLILLVCVCPALFGFEYAVGQIWDKKSSKYCDRLCPSESQDQASAICTQCDGVAVPCSEFFNIGPLVPFHAVEIEDVSGA